jgi:hypothetical protein
VAVEEPMSTSQDDFDDACHKHGYAHADDPAVELARILHRRMDNCHCGESNDATLHLARGVIWRMAAHGYVLCDIEYLARLSDQAEQLPAD